VNYWIPSFTAATMLLWPLWWSGMVPWCGGVCRRLLRSHHDAEDAFQATFLTLVRKAATIQPREKVGNWLYGVAHQTAVKARAVAARRGVREKSMGEMCEPAADRQDPWDDLQPVLDLELSRLPDHYRSVLVLCDLEGMTRKEAARQLGIPEGSVASRLVRARVMLAKRLTQRGVVISGFVAVLSAGSASASTPPALVASTIKAASLPAAGQAAVVVTAKVAALTDEVVKGMFMTRIKSVLGVVLVVGLALGGIGVGIGLSTNPAASAQAETPREAPVKKESPAAPVATKKDEKPPHIVEKTDMKGRMPSGLPSEATEDGSVVVKSFFASMPTYPDIRFREFFDPRFIKKHGLTDRDIAFEIANHQGIDSLHVADDNRTVLIVVEIKGGGREAFVMRCVVYEGHIYISPEKAPDPKTGIFKPWILRTKVK
jgi:RNA polymerase sigma factor (sigma-70 family)